MERVAVDLRIKNISTESITFPTSHAPIARGDRPPGYRHAGVEFVLLAPGQEKFATDLVALYGAPERAGSLIQLEPGERVTFRLPVLLSGNGYQDERNPILHPAPGLLIATEMWLFVPGDERFQCRFESSINSIPIAIGPTIAAVPEPIDDGRPPVVHEIANSSTSSDREVRVTGYRLGADHTDDVDVIFSNGPLSLPATIGNASYQANNRSNDPQELYVNVPSDVFDGRWYVTVRRRDVSSVPFAVTIKEGRVAESSGADMLSNAQVVRATVAPASSSAALMVDVVRVGPSDQIVVLYEGPDRPASFNAVEEDLLVLHFTKATIGEVEVTFSAGRRSIRLQAERQDEYNVAVRLPERMSRGPWRIDVLRKAAHETFRLPITMVVHSRPQ